MAEPRRDNLLPALDVTRCVASPQVTLMHLSRTTTSRIQDVSSPSPVAPVFVVRPEATLMPLMVYAPPWAAEHLCAGDQQRLLS